MFQRIDNTLAEALKEDERSYAWLGRKVGVSRSTVMRWADGWHEPDEETKARISATLRRDVTVLWPAQADAQPLGAAA